MNRRRLFYKLLSIVVIAFSTLLNATTREAHARGNVHIKIIASQKSNYQLQTAAIINEHLAEINIGSSIISLANIKPPESIKNTIYIAIGQTAIKTLQSYNINAPLLRISNKATADAKYNSTTTHLVLEQQQCREIELIKAIKPDWKSIGILSSISSVNKATELTKCAIKYNFNLLIYSVNDKDELTDTFEKAVRDSDAILALADPLIYNRQTVKNILLTSYRSGRPIIGYSESFIDAGAIAGIYTSPEAAGESATKIISDFLNNDWQFNRNIYYPTDFTVKTNRQVARSLGIDLPDESVLTETVLEMESQ